MLAISAIGTESLDDGVEHARPVRGTHCQVSQRHRTRRYVWKECAGVLKAVVFTLVASEVRQMIGTTRQHFQRMRQKPRSQRLVVAAGTHRARRVVVAAAHEQFVRERERAVLLRRRFLRDAAFRELAQLQARWQAPCG